MSGENPMRATGIPQAIYQSIQIQKLQAEIASLTAAHKTTSDIITAFMKNSSTDRKKDLEQIKQFFEPKMTELKGAIETCTKHYHQQVAAGGDVETFKNMSDADKQLKLYSMLNLVQGSLNNQTVNTDMLVAALEPLGLVTTTNLADSLKQTMQDLEPRQRSVPDQSRQAEAPSPQPARQRQLPLGWTVPNLYLWDVWIKWWIPNNSCTLTYLDAWRHVGAAPPPPGKKSTTQKTRWSELRQLIHLLMAIVETKGGDSGKSQLRSLLHDDNTTSDYSAMVKSVFDDIIAKHLPPATNDKYKANAAVKWQKWLERFKQIKKETDDPLSYLSRE